MRPLRLRRPFSETFVVLALPFVYPPSKQLRYHRIPPRLPGRQVITKPIPILARDSVPVTYYQTVMNREFACQPAIAGQARTQASTNPKSPVSIPSTATSEATHQNRLRP